MIIIECKNCCFLLLYNGGFCGENFSGDLAFVLNGWLRMLFGCSAYIFRHANGFGRDWRKGCCFFECHTALREDVFWLLIKINFNNMEMGLLLMFNLTMPWKLGLLCWTKIFCRIVKIWGMTLQNVRLQIIVILLYHLT